MARKRATGVFVALNKSSKKSAEAEDERKKQNARQTENRRKNKPKKVSFLRDQTVKKSTVQAKTTANSFHPSASKNHC